MHLLGTALEGLIILAAIYVGQRLERRYPARMGDQLPDPTLLTTVDRLTLLEAIVDQHLTSCTDWTSGDFFSGFKG